MAKGGSGWKLDGRKGKKDATTRERKEGCVGKGVEGKEGHGGCTEIGTKEARGEAVD